MVALGRSQAGLAYSAALLVTAIGLAAPRAYADAEFSLHWGSRSGPIITVVPATDTVHTAWLVAVAGPSGVGSYSISVVFDSDGEDELNHTSAQALLPPSFEINNSDLSDSFDSGPGSGGIVGFFAASSGSLSGLSPGQSAVLGKLTFQTTSNVNAGLDIDLIPFLNSATEDGVIGQDGVDLAPTISFEGASVVLATGVPALSNGVKWLFLLLLVLGALFAGLSRRHAHG